MKKRNFRRALEKSRKIFHYSWIKEDHQKGLTLYFKKILKKNLELFQNSCLGKRRKKDLYLYYCYAFLQTQRGNTEEIDDYYKALQEEDLSEHQKYIFYETRARYLSKNLSDKNAKEVKKLLDICLKKFPESSPLYCLRAKAYKVLKKYTLARKDFTFALHFNPERIEAFLEKIKILQDHVEPENMGSYESELKSNLDQIIELHVFSDEFNLLREKYQKKKTEMSVGIPYDKINFNLYCRCLKSHSTKVRETAEEALASMRPYKKIKKMIFARRDRRFFINVLSKIDAQIKDWKRICFLEMLSRVPKYGKIVQIYKFSKHLPTLKKILKESKNSIYLRFLAARVLTELPLTESRNFLWENLALLDKEVDKTKDEEKKVFRSAQILSAYCLYQKGYFYPSLSNFTYNLYEAYNRSSSITSLEMKEQAFLESLLGKMLVGNDSFSTGILRRMLQSPCLKLRQIAASRFFFVLSLKRADQKAYRSLLRFLKQELGQINSRKIIILNIFTNYFTRYHVEQKKSQREWKKFILEHFPDLFQNLVNELSKPKVDTKMAKAILLFFRATNSNIISENENLKKRVLKEVRKLWTRKDLELFALRLSAEFSDKKIFKVLVTEKTFLKKLAILLGLMEKKNIKKNILQLFKRLEKLQEDKDILMKGALHYFLFRYAPVTLFRDFHRKNPLNSPYPFVRFASLAGLSQKGKIFSSKKIQLLYKLGKIGKFISSKHKDLEKEGKHILALASALWFVRSSPSRGVFRKKLKQQKKKFLHQLKKMKNSKFHPFYKMYSLAIAWAYFVPIETLLMISKKHANDSKKYPEHMYWNKYNLFYKSLSKKKYRNFYRFRLEKALKFLEDFPNQPMYEDSVHLLASLYRFEGNLDKAVKLLKKAGENLQEKDRKLLELWVKIQIQKGINLEDIHRELYKKWINSERKLSALRKCIDSQEKIQKMRSYLYHKAQILRCFVYVKMHRKNSAKNEKINYEEYIRHQYLLDPGNPQAFLAIGYFYCFQKRYKEAIKIFSKAREIVKRSGKLHFWLAKISTYTSNANPKDLSKNLQYAIRYNYIRSLDQLQTYPEFFKFHHLECFRKLLNLILLKSNRLT